MNAASKILPSKLAEMLAEIELEGYTIKYEDGYGWFAEILGDALLLPYQETKEDCIVLVHQYLIDNQMFGSAE